MNHHDALLHQLRKAGAARRESQQRQREITAKIKILTQQALDAGVPLAQIAKAVGVTRQTIYTLMEEKDKK